MLIAGAILLALCFVIIIVIGLCTISAVETRREEREDRILKGST